MAVKYWYKAANSNDNWSTVGNWYLGSGGTGGPAGLPTSGDDVIFDENSTTSATVTIATTAAVCNSITFLGFTGTLAGSTVGLNVTNTYDPFPLPLFELSSTMNLTFTGTITFGGTGPGGVIYCGGKTIQGPVVFNNSAATFTFIDTFKTTATGTGGNGALVTLSAGSIVATNAPVEFGRFTSTTTGIKTFTCPNLYLKGTGALYTLGTGSTGLTSSITNIYVDNGTTTAKTLLFNTQFGCSGALNLGGSGNISIALGTAATMQPNVTVTNTGGTASVFNITATTTIKSLVFTTPITWSNAAITTTIAGNMTLVSGLNITATPNLVFSANATITTAGKSLVTGTLTTNASTTTTISGVLSSNANITFNSTVNTSDDVSTTGTLTITGISNLSGSIISAGVLTISGATAALNTVASSSITCTGLTTLTVGGVIAYAGTFTSGSITITSGSFTGTTGVAGNLVCTGVLTITLGSINTGGALLQAGSITQTGTGVKSITAPNVYLTGTGTLYTNTSSTNLTTSITNIYVTNAATTAKSLIFDTQFGSANLELGGSGNITFIPGTTKIPNVTVTNSGGLTSIFNIAFTGTIGNLIFTTPVTWNNSAAVTLTLTGDTFTLVSGLAFGANGHSSLVFSNNVAITLAGKSLVTGSLTTDANATFDGGITSNAAVILNSTASIPGNIVITNAALIAIGDVCTFTGDTISSGGLVIDGATASIIHSTGSLFNVTCSATFTIYQGSLNTNGGTLTAASIFSSGPSVKSITAPNVYLTGTSALYTASGGLTTNITNIYVNNASTTTKTLVFDTQFGSANLELGGSGNIVFTPGTTKIPNVTVTNSGGTASVFNIAANGTIGNLIFTTPVTWNNTAGVILTLTGDTFTLVSGLAFGANGHSSLVFSNTSNTVTITLAGKSLFTGSLTTNANTNVQFDGGINSNAAVTLNGTTSVLGDITPAALTIGGACTFTGTSVSATTIAINGANASIIHSTGLLFNVQAFGVFTITQGSLNTNGGTLTAASITSSGALTKDITALNVYLTGIGTLYTAGTSGLSSTISNIYVTTNTGSSRTLTFDTQFGSTNLEFGGTGSGSITFQPGTTFQPNLLISSTGNPIFNISTAGTIGNLIFSNLAVVTWSNNAVIITSVGSLFTLVSGVTIGAAGTPSLVFSNAVNITTAGKNLVTGTLTTNESVDIIGAFNSNAAVTLNGNPGNAFNCDSTFQTTGALTISGNSNTCNFSSTLTAASITVNSTSTVYPSGNVLCNGLTTISGGGSVYYSGTFTSSSVTCNSGSIQNDGGNANQTFTCTNILTLAGGDINTSNSASEMYIGSIITSGLGAKSISTFSNLYLTGTGTLFTPGAATGLSTSIPNIYVTNNSITARTLTFTDAFGSTNVYLQGTLSGAITFGGGVAFVPNVYVENTGGAVISFQTGTFTNLTFSTGTNVTWTNAASQTITMQGNLVMVSTMNTLTTTPTLLFNTAASITFSGKTLYTGSIIVNNAQVDILDNFNSNIPVTVQDSGTLNTKGFLTTGLLSIITSSTISTTGSAFSIGSLTLLDGTVNLGSNSHICTGNVSATAYSYINNGPLTINGTLTISGGGSLDLNSSVNIIGLTTLTGGSTLNTYSNATVFSTVTITNGFINTSSNNYVCTGETTLTEGDFGNAGAYFTGTLTVGGGSAAKNINVTDLVFTGTGSLYAQGTGVTLSTGPDNIYITNSTSAAKSLTCGTQFPLTTNIPIYLGGSGSGSITIAPASVCIPVINVTNTGGANISIAGTGTQIITSLIFANTSNAIWNNGAITLNIQADLILSNNVNMTVSSSPTIVFNVGSSLIALYGKTLTAPISVTATAYVSCNTDFSSASTVTVTDGTFDIVSNNFTATTLTIAVNGAVRAIYSNTTVNLASLLPTGSYQHYEGSLICSGAITVTGSLSLGINLSKTVNTVCQTITGSTVNCLIVTSRGSNITLTGTGTVWSVPATASTISVGGIIRITNTAATNINFAGGSWGYYELIFDRGISPNNNIISGSNTFTNLRDLGTVAHSLILTTGTTQAVGHFDVKGSPGNSIAIARSGVSGVATLFKFPEGLVICDWVTVTNVTAANTDTFYSGPNSTLTNAANWVAGGRVRQQSALGVG